MEDYFGFETKKAPREKSKVPWSFDMRSFCKIHFINPQEVQGQVVGSFIYWWGDDAAKLSKSLIWVNRKIE